MPTFTFIPDEGYEVDKVIIDGQSVDKPDDNTYTFDSVTENHNIEVTFKKKEYPINAASGEHGTVTPSGEISVKLGEDQVYVFTPEDGYRVEDVTVDGISVGTPYSYIFENVTGPHTIDVQYEKITNTAVIEVNKDDEPWSEQRITLKSEDGRVCNTIETADGVYSADVQDGTYQIWKNGKDTAETIVISRDTNTKPLDYYTLILDKETGITGEAGGGHYPVRRYKSKLWCRPGLYNRPK